MRDRWKSGATVALALLVVLGGTAFLLRARDDPPRERSRALPIHSLVSPTAAAPGRSAPATPAAYLAWVSSGLPAGFAAGAAGLPGVSRDTAVTQDTVWMTKSATVGGAAIDAPAPFMVPIDAAGIDPVRFASFLPDPYRTRIAGLRPGQAVLSRTSANLRRMGVGGTMTFLGGVTVKVVGVVPDVLVGAQELVTDTATAARLGVTHQRYLLLAGTPGHEPDVATLRRELTALLPVGNPLPAVQVRAPGQTTYLRSADLVLPQALMKVRFGEWAGRPDPADPGFIQIDPAWTASHIVTTSVPVLGTVTCNRALIAPLRSAMAEVAARGLQHSVHDYEGCYVAKYILNDPHASISHHAWGAAVDINAQESPFGATPAQNPALVQIMQRWGFIWGGSFMVPDGHHFEYLRPPGAPSPTVISGPGVPAG